MSRLGPELSLEDVDDWFKIGKASTRIKTVPRSSTGGRPLDPATGKPAIPTEKAFIPPYKRHTRVNNPNQTAYAAHYQQQEYEETIKQTAQGPPVSFHGSSAASSVGGMERLELDSTITGLSGITLPEGMTQDEAVEVYQHYKFDHDYDDQLPITCHKEDIINTIEANQVTVIQGPTGSGKTTQVPQYILDSYAKMNKYCNIVVTQPRRIAAMSIAKRVSYERGWQIGGVCGYQVAMDKTASDDTRLLYCTTGVLLQKLINQKSMQQYTHIILDEVHERDQESDFCLLVVRKLLRSNSRDVKVVLMSATIESKLFANYFGIPIRGQLSPAPVYNVEGRTYKVSEFYVEDLKSLGELPELDANYPKATKEACILTENLIKQFDLIEMEEQKVTAPNGFAPKRGSVLIFLPGLAEINDVDEHLDRIRQSKKLWVLPLHSSITGEEQVKVFDCAPPGQRKIILSTNIAESSITVPDIKYVIDFCLTKNLVCDPDTNYTSLQIQWASKANCIQRKGRAGRVSNGRVYRMITRRFWKEYLPEYGIPEMQRCPLEQLVLQVKILDLGEPKAILGIALSPPNLDDLERTILMLKEIGALTTSVGGMNPHDGELTFVGRVLGQLPVDVAIGKFIMMGHVFGLLEETLIIGAALSLKSMFARPFKAYLEAYKSQIGWANQSYSDCIAILLAYRLWQHMKEAGSFRRPGQSEQEWGKRSFIQIRRIREVEELVKDLYKRLDHFNLKTPRGPPKQVENDPEELLLLKLVMCAAFYPNYFTQGSIDEKEAVKMMSGKNPFTCVMVRGLPSNQGSLYRSPVEALFQCCEADPSSSPRAYFEETRAYIEFTRSRTQNVDKILPAVYIAIKMRELRVPLEIHLIDSDIAAEKMRQLSLVQESRSKMTKRLQSNRVKAVSDQVLVGDGQSGRQIPLPGPKQSVVQIFVTEILDVGHFWAHYGDDETWQRIANLQQEINLQGGQNLKHLPSENVHIGMYCLAPFEDQTVEFYRARIDKIIQSQVEVFYLDYGNVEMVPISRLKIIPTEFLEIPFQAFECQLCGIKPSNVKCPDGRWSEEAKQEFVKYVAGEKNLRAQVFSVVHGVLRVDLFKKLSIHQELHINQKLIDTCYADKAEESYFSKQSNTQRYEESMYSHRELDDWTEVPIDLDTDDRVQKEQSLRRARGPKVKLNGPHSPLEMQFYSMTNVGRLRSVRIDRDSVNSVALNDNPHDEHQRLMVASSVGVSSTGSTMLARGTTILPNINGLPALAALLFCPTAELRTDPKKTRYTGALCGLGWDQETRGPALPDHDMEVVFDTYFDVQDLTMINSVRLAINLAIGSEDSVADWGQDAVRKIQENARKKILGLVKRRRESIEPTPFQRPYRWNQVAPEDILEPRNENMSQDNILLNLHCGIALAEETPESHMTEAELKAKELQNKRLHVNWLHNKQSRSMEPEMITCELCHMTVQTQKDLMLHLATRKHKLQEALLI